MLDDNDEFHALRRATQADLDAGFAHVWSQGAYSKVCMYPAWDVERAGYTLATPQEIEDAGLFMTGTDPTDPQSWSFDWRRQKHVGRQG